MDATVWVKLYNAVCIHAICCLVQSPDPTQENRPETFSPAIQEKKTPKGTFDLLTKIQKENKSTIHLVQIQLRT